MCILLLLLLAIILGHWVLTDSRRVRAMAEQYLSQVLGARVEVQSATLSIFEGLRLDGIRVMVDESSSPDAVVFTADTFRIDYSPRSILQGKLEASQILAIGPHVVLTEDIATGTWNYQRLVKREPSQRRPRTGGLALPQITLRDARVDYNEYADGKLVPSGSMAIEGRLWPAGEAGHYSFDLQSRGQSEGIGPVVSGQFDTLTGALEMRLRNFQFGRDILSMSPALPRKWWQDHQLSGWIDIPELSFTPGGDDKRQSFRMLTDLHGVTLMVRPEEWRSRHENEVNDRVGELLSFSRLGALRTGGVLEQVYKLAQPSPIRLEKVSGRFIFTEDGIQIRDLAGRVETNAFRIDGQIDGYYPDAPARVVIATPPNEDIYLPRAPRFVESLPGTFRELFGHLRPEGTGRLWIEVRRDEPGARPAISGRIDVVDGNFTFDRLPYPLRNVTGRINIESNPETRTERVVLKDLRGYGLKYGPNADKTIQINGVIGPLNADSGVQIQVLGKDIRSEPALIEALPREARAALAGLQGNNGQQYPSFTINLDCNVLRPPGPRSDWKVDADIELTSASGNLKAFAYPLENLTGWIRLRRNTLLLDGIAAQRGDVSLNVDGSISWTDVVKNNVRHTIFDSDVALVAKNVPVDDTLMAALSPNRRAMIEKLGLSGVFDLNGHISPQGDDPAHYELDIDFRDGTLWPGESTFTVSDVEAAIHLNPQAMQIRSISGKRADGTFAGSGELTFGQEAGNLKMQVRAENLLLDAPLYKLLPARGQEVWDSLKPIGSIDADITYDSSNNTDATSGFSLVIQPRELSVTPSIVPVPFHDVTGKISLLAGTLTLENVRAHQGNGNGEVHLSGGATLGAEDVWNVAVSANDLTITPELRDALPPALASLAKDIDLNGSISFDFPKFHYVVPENKSEPGRSDLAGNVVFNNASFKLGVPFAEVAGKMTLEASVQKGALATINGSIDIDSTKLADRPATELHAELVKATPEAPLSIRNLKGKIAGGDVSGQVNVVQNTDNPRYALELFVRNAELSQLVPQSDQEIRGQLTASLAMEGSWTDPRSRRGRGEISVSGRNMYKIPVMLGLLEVTNLSLPINSPFKQGMTRYSVQGPAVTLEQIELRSDQMRMTGNGSIDFDNRNVRLTFTTDNPNWPSVPLIGDLVKQARNNLFQIHVRGTVERIKVSATTIDAFETTIDEVFREGPRRE